MRKALFFLALCSFGALTAVASDILGPAQSICFGVIWCIIGLICAWGGILLMGFWFFRVPRPLKHLRFLLGGLMFLLSFLMVAHANRLLYPQ